MVQSATPVIDANGGRTLTWATVCEVWGAVEPQPFVVGTEKAEVLTLVSVRYRADLEVTSTGARRDLRALSEGRTYAVLAVIDPEQRHRELILHCAEIFV